MCLVLAADLTASGDSRLARPRATWGGKNFVYPIRAKKKERKKEQESLATMSAPSLQAQLGPRGRETLIVCSKQ